MIENVAHLSGMDEQIGDQRCDGCVRRSDVELSDRWSM
jgi:hypothetical protein